MSLIVGTRSWRVRTRQPKLAMTLIEVLIALAVFSIGILGVLSIVTQNMARLDDIKTNTIATSLAKEGIELMFQIRDTNRLAHTPWDCAINNQHPTSLEDMCHTYFLQSGTQTNALLVGFATDNPYTIEAIELEPNFS